MISLFVNVYLKLFFLLTPFFVVSTFLSMTQAFSEARKQQLAVKVTVAVVAISLALYLFGKYLFAIFGITLDAFRVGAGALLFISAIDLVRGAPGGPRDDQAEHLAVVPLAVPVTVGPATTGALLVMGAELDDWMSRAVACAALIAAGLTVGVLLYMAGRIERWLGQTGLAILSKLTGLVLASMAAQIIFTGIRHFLGEGPR